MTPPVPDDPLFILDYDGTLAYVTDRPHQAKPHPEVVDLLNRLERRHPVAILTGRSVRDVGELLGVAGIRVIGVHGIESGTTDGPVESLVPDRVMERLERLRQDLPDIAGLEVEDKDSAIALHYRNAEDPAEAEKALRTWSERVPDELEPLWGKKVLEIRPLGYDKGRAARTLMEEHPGRTPVVIGDDTTDEEAFRAVEEGVTIKVGPGETAARYRLAGVDEVVAYLRRFTRPDAQEGGSP